MNDRTRTDDDDTDAPTEHKPADAPQKPIEGGELDDLFRIVDRLPFLGSLKRDLEELRGLLYERRSPRVLAIGTGGSGKTSVANAMMRLAALPARSSVAAPADTWVRIDAAGRHFDWMEIASGPLDEGRAHKIQSALDESAPDVVLFVCRAAELAADAALTRGTLARVFTMLDDANTPRPVVLGVLTHVDRIATTEASERGVVFSLGDTQKIDTALAALKKKIEEDAGPKVRLPTAVVSGGSGPDAPRWNVEALADAIAEALPAAAKVEAVRALGVSRTRRRELARTVVNRCAAAAVTVGLMPVPFSDAVLLLPLQGLTVSSVAYIAGQPWDRRAALEWLTSVGVMGGAAFGLRFGAQQLVKLVPGAGMLISGSVAGAGTLAIGRSAIAYFVDGPGLREPKALLAPNAAPR